MSDPSQHIVCPACGALNRVPPGKSADVAKCGRCHREPRAMGVIALLRTDSTGVDGPFVPSN